MTQTGPQHAAALSETRKNISQPTLTLIKETNKVVSEVKLDDTHLAIHAFSRQLKGNDLAAFGYTEAAQGDRVVRVDLGTVQTSH